MIELCCGILPHGCSMGGARVGLDMFDNGFEMLYFPVYAAASVAWIIGGSGGEERMGIILGVIDEMGAGTTVVPAQYTTPNCTNTVPLLLRFGVVYCAW